MTTQDMITISALLTMVIIAFVFPGGPGTPRRFCRLTPARAETWSA